MTVVDGAAAPRTPTPLRPPRPSDPAQVLMLIRHAEKPPPSRAVRGISPSGHLDDRSLTVAGWQRAGALVELFAPVRDRPPAGLWRPDAVYAAAARGGRSRRSIETVQPLAQRLGIPVLDGYAPGEELQLVTELLDRPGATLVSWHHKSLRTITAHLGEVTPAPPRHWPGDRYDLVWVFVRDGGGGWGFTEVPQLLLPGDRSTPVAA